MPVASFATFRLIEHLHSDELSLLMTGDHHLSDPLPVIHDEVLIRQVNQQYAHLTTVVREFSTVIPFFKASPLRGLT